MAKAKKKKEEVKRSKQTRKSNQREIAKTEIVSEFMTERTRAAITNARKHRDDIPDKDQKFKKMVTPDGFNNSWSGTGRGVFNREGAPGMPASRKVAYEGVDEKAPAGSLARKKWGKKKRSV